MVSFLNIVYLVGAFQCGTAILVMGVQNPIHSILFLILIFFLGTVLLFIIQLEYYARLFLIVYVGAIVVLFLFIIRRLELKLINIVRRLNDIFSFKYMLVAFFIISLLCMFSFGFFDIKYFILYQIDSLLSNYYIESINYINWAKVTQHISQLQALGSVLFTEYRRSIFLISILLFLSRVGALTLTLSIVSNLNIGSIKNTFLLEEILITKSQNVSYQLMRNSNHILKLY